jgi:hypothetical protein
MKVTESPLMPLTKTQKKKIEAIKQIAELAGLDFWNVENEPDNDVRNISLDFCNDRLVRAAIVSHYVLFDELLSDIICQHFFDPSKSSFELWKTKKFRNFNYYVLEELSLVRKLSLVKEIRVIPKPIEETLRLTNSLRNAVAHSFFPMNKRDFKRTKKVTYKGKDVFTIEGMTILNTDTDKAVAHLVDLAFGKRRQKIY